MAVPERADVVIVGGGLAGCLFFMAMKSAHPKLHILLLEKNDRLGGNHTWCLHDTDIPAGARSWFFPLLSKSWYEYEVHFPQFSRTLHGAYHAIKSEDLASKVMASRSARIEFNCEVTKIQAVPESEDIEIHLSDGKKVLTQSLLLARGWKPVKDQKTVGWQKFVGLELKLKNSHGLIGPILKDAQVQQIDGYRFVYSLPFSEQHLLVEDTYYSNHSGLKVDRIEKEILHYAERKNWQVDKVLRREIGSLPLSMVPMKLAVAEWPSIGAESDFINPVTGYTLPTTLRLVQALIDRSNFTIPSMKRVIGDVLRKEGQRQKYYAMLNRMMFLAAKNEQRYRILERFYHLPEPVIDRFYSGQISIFDQARILIGKPPVPVRDALKAILTFPSGSSR